MTTEAAQADLLSDLNGGYGWHPIAWELARHARLGAVPCGDVLATLALAGGLHASGRGPTSNAAMRNLARELTALFDLA